MSDAGVDAEALFVTFLAAAFPASFVCTETPPDLDELPSTIKVLALPGGRLFTLTSPVVSVDCFASGRQAARALALAVDRQIVWNLRGKVIGGVAVVRIATVSGPAWRPYDTTSLRRFGATYRAGLHDVS